MRAYCYDYYTWQGGEYHIMQYHNWKWKYEASSHHLTIRESVRFDSNPLITVTPFPFYGNSPGEEKVWMM